MGCCAGKDPAAILTRLHEETIRALKNPTVIERLAMPRGEPMPMTSAEFGAFVRKEIEINATLVKAGRGVQLRTRSPVERTETRILRWRHETRVTLRFSRATTDLRCISIIVKQLSNSPLRRPFLLGVGRHPSS